MITEDMFKKRLINNLENGVIESYVIKHGARIFQYINDNQVLHHFYQEFNKNYESCSIESELMETKINDFIYHLEIFVDFIDISLKCLKFRDIKPMVLLGNFDFYSAVSYNREDDLEIYIDYMESFKELNQKTHKDFGIGI